MKYHLYDEVLDTELSAYCTAANSSLLLLIHGYSMLFGVIGVKWNMEPYLQEDSIVLLKACKDCQHVKLLFAEHTSLFLDFWRVLEE